MQKTMTIREVARRAGVSTATVSRAMNRSGPVSSEAREAIDRVIQESGFRPNIIGRQLKTAHTRTIGVLVPSLQNPIFADAVAGIEQSAALDGYNVLLASSCYRAEKELAAVDTFLGSRVEGMILTVADENRSVALNTLVSSGLPFVLMFNPVCRADYSSVSIDNRAAAAQLVDALLDLGHRRIAMIAGRLSESDRSVQRRAGYEDALRMRSVDVGLTMEVGFENPDLAGRLATLVHRPDAPTAYFCSTDMLAIFTIRALARLGKKVPRDVSVVGFDGIAIGEHLSPSLSTAVQPAQEMGAWAAQHLIARIDGTESETNLVLPHRIRSGESWGPSPMSSVCGSFHTGKAGA